MTDAVRMHRAVAEMLRLEGCQRGGLTIPVALTTLIVLAVVIFGVDLTRIYIVQSRLQMAVDSAALVAGRPINTSTAFDDAKSLFWSNFDRTDKPTGTGFMLAVASTPEVTRLDADTVKVKASATLKLSPLLALSSREAAVSAEAAVKRAMFGLELALVLDVTGSMKSNDNIGGLRAAATDLVNILFGTEETVPNLTVSVVPFTATVNLGAGHADWLAPGSLDQNKYANAKWAGCVEARNNGEDSTDTIPATAPFRPYFWQSTFNVYKKAGVVIPGDNDWTSTIITETNQATLPDNTAVGPNLGCPAAPIVPLTTSKATVLATISNLKATFRSGTMANQGLQAGWFTISPKWSALWGKSGSPLPYNTLNMDKVVVMMTDGNNEWYDYPNRPPGKASTTYDGEKVDADYTAYGRLAENRLNILMPSTGNLNNDLNTANIRVRTEVNSRTTALCTRMKAAGIKIYTIILGSLDSGTQTLWRNCATKPEYYFNSPDKAALASAFQQIGSKLASLRISQ